MSEIKFSDFATRVNGNGNPQINGRVVSLDDAMELYIKWRNAEAELESLKISYDLVNANNDVLMDKLNSIVSSLADAFVERIKPIVQEIDD